MYQRILGINEELSIVLVEESFYSSPVSKLTLKYCGGLPKDKVPNH